jgi:hypothetical protein
LKGFHLHVPQNPLYLQANSGEQQMKIAIIYKNHFSYIVDVSCIGGGNRGIRTKPQTPAASHGQTSDNVVSSTPHHERTKLQY